MRIIVLAGAAALLTPFPSAPIPRSSPATDSAAHALNRLGFGATPGLVDSVARIGTLRWIDQQLDVPAREARLAEVEKPYDLLQISTADLSREFVAARRQEGGSRREIRALLAQLPELTVLRAVAAEDQLREVMADFWTNHFNVFSGKNLVRVYLRDYLEHTIRPNALGTFEGLLLATAADPAMLVYLDNAQSVAPGSEPPALRGAERARRALPDSTMDRIRARMPTGLNENYARELLELHTLGVDGGYGQADVVAVARILTGWSFNRGLRRGGTPGEFVFNEWAHDDGAKRVLGTEFPSGHGRDEGVRLLQLLARHPATLHHVSAKLCARFVNDAPPDGCIDDAVAAWKRSNGNIREILRAIVRSPDFWADANRSAKVKTPLEFVVSAVRAVGGVPDTASRLPAAIAKLGQPLFQQTAPTGYPETQADWVNSGALLNRMTFAVALAAGTLPGLAVDLDRMVPASLKPEDLVAAVDAVVLNGGMTATTRSVILREISGLADPAARRAMAVGLALGGPEFQRQ